MKNGIKEMRRMQSQCSVGYVPGERGKVEVISVRANSNSFDANVLFSWAYSSFEFLSEI